MKSKIFWTSLALKDLSSIQAYIQKDHLLASKKEAKKIRQNVEKLAHFPKSGRSFLGLITVRELIAGKYRIFYKICPGRIEILRIYHGKQDVFSFESKN